jgi:hypothetical protein
MLCYPAHDYAEPPALRTRSLPKVVKTRPRSRQGVATAGVGSGLRLELANVSVKQAKTAASRRQVKQVTLLNCASYLNKADGISVADSTESRLTLRPQANVVGLRPRAAATWSWSPLVGVNARAQVQLAEGTQGYYGDFNTFHGGTVGVRGCRNTQARTSPSGARPAAANRAHRHDRCVGMAVKRATFASPRHCSVLPGCMPLLLVRMASCGLCGRSHKCINGGGRLRHYTSANLLRCTPGG